MKFILNNYKSITKYKDNHSRVVKKFIDLMGIDYLNKKQISSLLNLYDLLHEMRQAKLEIERKREEES